MPRLRQQQSVAHSPRQLDNVRRISSASHVRRTLPPRRSGRYRQYNFGRVSVDISTTSRLDDEPSSSPLLLKTNSNAVPLRQSKARHQERNKSGRDKADGSLQPMTGGWTRRKLAVVSPCVTPVLMPSLLSRPPPVGWTVCWRFVNFFFSATRTPVLPEPGVLLRIRNGVVHALPALGFQTRSPDGVSAALQRASQAGLLVVPSTGAGSKRNTTEAYALGSKRAGTPCLASHGNAPLVLRNDSIRGLFETRRGYRESWFTQKALLCANSSPGGSRRIQRAHYVLNSPERPEKVRFPVNLAVCSS